jgi:hypothetical protein
MSLLSSLISVLCLASLALVCLVITVAIFMPRKRKIYAHQVQRRTPADTETAYSEVVADHQIDPLCYQLDSSGHDKYGQTWETLHGQRCAEEHAQHRIDTMRGAMRGMASDLWIARINRPGEDNGD